MHYLGRKEICSSILGVRMIIQISEEEACEVLLEHAQLGVTGICNMACQHCRASDELGVELSTQTVQNILDFVTANSCEKYSLTISGGEPFARADLVELVDIATSHPISRLTITTNGSLCTRAVLEKLVRCASKVEIVLQVSIDSANAPEHDSFRNFPGAFSTAVDSIRLSQEVGLITTVRSTIRKGATSSMRPLAELAVSLGVSEIAFGAVVPFGRAATGDLCMPSTEKRKFLEEVVNLRGRLAGGISIASEDPLMCALEYETVGLRDDGDDEQALGGCTAGINTFNVTAEGIVTPCAVLPLQILNANGKSGGEIEEEYRESPVVKRLLLRSFAGKCGSCRLKNVCGGCRAIPFSRHGDPYGSDSGCWL
jgi:AdoMet-dependent heme synthase